MVRAIYTQIYLIGSFRENILRTTIPQQNKKLTANGLKSKH